MLITVCLIQLVSDLSIADGDKRKIGYYTGMIVGPISNFVNLQALTESVAYPQVSLHYAAEAITVLQWSRLSDHIGRKPVLLLGLLGTVVSTICFGFSRSLWALVLRY